MTAQVGDRFIYKEDNYSIVAISNPIQFNPLDYGIKPVACCSACWNGYWLFMEYTGKILIGKGFINKYYIHMGYQRAWAYKVLNELIFDKGELIKTVDHSEMAKKLRLELENKAEEISKTGDNIPLFVKESFSLEMKDKAWWIG